MRGQILNYDAASGTGAISGDDGVRYAFTRAVLRQQVTPWSGAPVDFVPQGTDATDVFVLTDAAAHSGAGVASSNNDWNTLFFSAEGRIPRARFWGAWGILLAVRLVGGLIPFIGFFIGIACIWADVCINAKRLHDMGRTGWWQIVPMLVGFTAWVVGIALFFTTLAARSAATTGKTTPEFDPTIFGGVAIAFGVWFVVAIGFLIWIGATPSDASPNRFGPPPGQGVANAFD